MVGYGKKDGKTVTTALEEAPLISLAQAGGGEYIHLVNDKTLTIEWATKLAGSKVEPREKHIYQYPLTLALLILIAGSATGLLHKKKFVA